MKFKSSFKIRKDLCAEFEALPPIRSSRWTPEADALLLRYWRKKNQYEFAAMFARKFFKLSVRALEQRYHNLDCNIAASDMPQK